MSSLNELQKDKLQIILNDKLLLETIEQILNEVAEKMRPIANELNDNSVLGEKYRAYETAKKIIAEGFIDLSFYKTYPKDKKSFDKSK